MADADEYLRTGDLAGARAALVEAIKTSPQDQRARMFMFQLLCVQGDWDERQAHLRSLAQLSPEAADAGGAPTTRPSTPRATRAAAFAGQALQRRHRHLSVGRATGAGPDARGPGPRRGRRRPARAQAFDQAGDTPGEIDGRPFTWIADGGPASVPPWKWSSRAAGA